MKVKPGDMEAVEAEGFAEDVVNETIDPNEFLKNCDAQRVQNAVRVIQEFKNALNDAGLLE